MLPPVLVIGDTANARARASGTVGSSEFVGLSAVSLDEAAEGLGRSASLSAIWLEMDEAPSPAGRRLLERLGTDAARLANGLVVATRIEHLDEVLSCLRTDRAELLVDAIDAERLGALTLAASSFGKGASEGGNEASSARLRQLSEEVSRIASALARLSTSSSQPPLSPATIAPPRDDVPNVSAEALRSMIRARRQRASFLPADLFADPAWDMLLDLLQAEIVQHRVPVSSLCIAAAVPATTALRWIKAMTDRGLLVRKDDPHDGRRVFIEMAPATSASLRHYFKDVGMAAI
jgi:DNA-binding MarR family transcriptional regulator